MATLRRGGKTSKSAGAKDAGLLVREVNSPGIQQVLEKILLELQAINAQLNDITELES